MGLPDWKSLHSFFFFFILSLFAYSYGGGVPSYAQVAARGGGGAIDEGTLPVVVDVLKGFG